MTRHLLLLLALAAPVFAQDGAKAKPKKPKPAPAPFSWVSPAPPARLKSLGCPETLEHATFKSPSMGVEVGYYIYLPPGYDLADKETRYPVVYHLHGGRPGSEAKSIKLATYPDTAIRAGEIEPAIYVFPNGGPMSWYNYPQLGEQAMGEDVFIHELLPHIDKKYRTLGGAEGRGLEGFSQGGRGTTRILFKHPEKFASFAPGGSGYEPEKRIQENGGAESTKVVFAEGDNAWDLAKRYASRKRLADPPILLWVGTKGFNYEFNLKYSKFLNGLGIGHQLIACEGATHSATQIYDAHALEIMRFHQKAILGTPESGER